MTIDNCCFYLQNRLIQTIQTGGQRYSDSSPFSIPWLMVTNKCFFLPVTFLHFFMSSMVQTGSSLFQCCKTFFFCFVTDAQSAILQNWATRRAPLLQGLDYAGQMPPNRIRANPGAAVQSVGARRFTRLGAYPIVEHLKFGKAVACVSVAPLRQATGLRTNHQAYLSVGSFMTIKSFIKLECLTLPSLSTLASYLRMSQLNDTQHTVIQQYGLN